MKLNLLVSVCSIAVIASTQSAFAQETRGARFSFAPNIYKTESSRIPKGYSAPDPVHNVRAGAVPSSNLLGVDPSMLAKPAPPPPVMAAQPAMPMVSAQASVPRAAASFNPMFGKPMVAQLPAPVPQQAVAMPITPKPATAAPVAPAAKRHFNANKSVAARLVKPTYRPVTPRTASPAVASYGNGFGYVPGAFLPSSGVSSSAEVKGRLLRHK